MKRLPAAAVAAACVWMVTTPTAHAEDELEAEVRAAVEDYYAYTRENLRNPADAISADGSLQFWSSGGLVLSIGPDDPPIEYDSFNVHPKHISVLRLSDDSAAALYYAEGSMTPKGSASVPHYLTRVLAVYVREGASWKVRAGHWSPMRGGAGISRATE